LAAILLTTWACATDDKSAVIGTPDRKEGNLVFEERLMTASLSQGVLEVRLPVGIADGNALAGSYDLELAGLDSNYVARQSGSFDLAAGDGALVVRFDAPPTLEDSGQEARYVLRYEVLSRKGLVSGSRSLFSLLPKYNVVLMSTKTVPEGQENFLRVLLNNPITGAPLAGTQVSVTLTPDVGDPIELGVFTDEKGSSEIKLPPMEAGGYQVQAALTGDAQAINISSSVQVLRNSRLLLTLDKPLYQPGQTMYLRSLALRKPALEPEAGQDILFEVLDGKGNKVFRQAVLSDEFGVAATQFQLANQVNMGVYKVRAQVGEVVTEKSVTVDRYVLPKFKLDLSLDDEWFRPGQTVAGMVKADYFFGEPVKGGTVTVTAYRYAATWIPFLVQDGTTSADGVWSFSFDLPDYLVGMPLDEGKALILMEVSVADTAGQKVATSRQLLVSESDVDLVLVAENQRLLTGVPNRFYLFVSDPAGNPVSGSVKLSPEGTTEADTTLDFAGVAPTTVLLTPEGDKVTVALDFDGEDGSKGTASFSFDASDTSPGVLLRTNRTFYKVGESADLQLLASGTLDRAFIDVVRENQTVLTTAVPIAEGRGSFVLDLDNGLTGDLVITAWFIANNGTFVRDSRVVFVEGDNGLSVSVTGDRDSYLPGEKALLDVKVLGSDGQPAVASVGLQVVDEAVFALSEMAPGLLKLFFQLQDELMNPTWSSVPMGLSFSDLISEADVATPGSAEEQGVQDSGEAILAALGDLDPGMTKAASWDSNQNSLKTVLKPVFEADLAKICSVVRLKLGNTFDAKALVKWLDSGEFLFDSWGGPYRLTVQDEGYRLAVLVAGDGPDELGDTWDDQAGWCEFYQGYYGDDGFPAPGAGEGQFGGGGGEWGEDDTNVEEPGGEDPDKGDDEASGDSGVRVRKWFPETLFVEPSLITDSNGEAQVEVPLADSITTWRVSSLASTKDGRVGAGSDGLKVFQDFFVDIDFPVQLTRGDEVSFPIVVYNYLPEAQNVELELAGADWFESLGGAITNLVVEPGDVQSVLIPVRVTGVGLRSLTVYATGQNLADAVQRTVLVKPDGKPIDKAEGARFKVSAGPGKDTVVKEITFPGGAVPDSQHLLIRVQPGFTSQVVSGMDSMLQLPGGCFEQTTSSAWPNVLVLRYLRESDQLTPEIELRALDYIGVGYQRILTFECASGGFNWWEGDDPGNAILGAVAVSMLTDTSEVYSAVEAAVINRTADWLGSVQKGDGSWSEEEHLHAGNENLGASSLRATCYIALALAESGFATKPSVTKAVTYAKSKLPSDTDPYTRALCANALAAANATGPVLSSLLTELDETRIQDDKGYHWSSNGATLVNSYGEAADVELTALAALAFIRTGTSPALVDGAVSWLIASRDPQGNWGYNTQATVLALKAFIGAATAAPAVTDATVKVRLNGEPAGEQHFDNFNAQILWQIEPAVISPDSNLIEFEVTGTGNLSWQLVYGWNEPFVPGAPSDGPLVINVAYDQTTLEVDDTVTATVTIKALDDSITGTVMVDLGLPPGFALHTEDLAAAKADGLVSEYETTAKQILLYIDNLEVGKTRTITYGLTALYPVTVQSGVSKAYLYYNKEVSDTEAPIEFVVK
jgi:hypothetical protein